MAGSEAVAAATPGGVRGDVCVERVWIRVGNVHVDDVVVEVEFCLTSVSCSDQMVCQAIDCFHREMLISSSTAAEYEATRTRLQEPISLVRADRRNRIWIH